MTRALNYIKDYSKKHFFITYTLLFIIFSTVAFLPWIFTKSSFVWNIDGINQHYPALLYIGRFFRETIQSIFTGQFSIKTWDIRLGLGSDIIGTMNYYCLGDPLDLLMGFIPARFTEFGYDALVVIRMYLAGLAFSAFARYKKVSNSHIYAGALFYVFTCYVLMYGIKHPLFINPMIYFPIALIGLDKLLKKERSILFTVMVTIAVASNFYFFYIITIALAIYAIYRIYQLYKGSFVKELFKGAIRCGLYYLLGMVNACILLLPMLFCLFDTARAKNASIPSLIYSINYYINIPSTTVGFGTITAQTNLGFFAVALFLFIVFVQIRKKEFFSYKLFTLIAVIGLLTPIFGFMMSGFSYVANRWIFIFAFIIGMGIVRLVEVFDEVKIKHLIIPAILVVLTIVTVLVNPVMIELNTMVTLSVMVIGLLISLLIIKFKKNTKAYIYIILIALMVVELGGKSMSLFMLNDKPIVPDQFVKAGQVYNETSNDALRKIKSKDKGIYRVESMVDTSSNYALIDDTPSVASYFSITPANITKTMFKLENAGFFSTNWIRNFSRRSRLTELASVKYYVCKSTDTNAHTPPYNYKYMDKVISKKNENVHYYIYKNTNPLPLVYGYDNIMLESKWNKLHASEKEQAMLQAAVIKDKSLASPKIKETTPVLNTKQILGKEEIINQIKNSNSNIAYVKKGDKLYVRFAPAYFKLNFKGLNNNETYLDIDGIKYQNLSTKQFADVNKEYNNSPALQKTYNNVNERLRSFYLGAVVNNQYSAFNYCSKYYEYKGAHSAMCNMGYSKDGVYNASFYVGAPGTYKFKNLRVLSTPMDNFNEYIDKLKVNVSKLKINNNTITCNVDNNKQKILCVAIPYSKGWTAIVDGKPAKVFETNGMYCGLDVPKGKHSIQLHYTSPGLKLGAILTATGIVLTIVIFFYQRRRRKKY